MNVYSNFTLACASGAVLAAAIAAPAGAATQGDPAARSAGTVVITATVAGRALVLGLEDLALAPAGASADLTAREPLCIWTNTAARRYAVTASGSGADGAFELSGPGGAVLPFTAQWLSGPALADGAALAPGTPLLADLPGGPQPPCTAATRNAGLAIAVPQPASTGSGVYAGRLTVLISPQ